VSGLILEMTVSGIPETKGSWIGLGGGKMKRDNPRELGWANAVGWAAKAQRRGAPASPARIRVDVEFRIPPPEGNRHKRDIDKLLRSVFDAMSKIAYCDDEQIDMVIAEKVVTKTGHGATINVREHKPSPRAGATSPRVMDFVRELAAEPCEYGDKCPAFGSRHGTCINCKARRALGEQ
jgi:Holliday junction resolvase RusA-like endonuclease